MNAIIYHSGDIIALVTDVKNKEIRFVVTK